MADIKNNPEYVFWCNGRLIRHGLQHYGSRLRHSQQWYWHCNHVSLEARADHEVHHPSAYGWDHRHLQPGDCSTNSLTDGITLYRSFLQMGAGMSVGLIGLAAGFAIGIIGDAGVQGTAQQLDIILILIFAEVLSL